MRLKLENVGPIESCDMELNDISVVVGKNASGKSSIGKALFSVLHSISNSQKEVYKEELDGFLERTLNETLRLIGNGIDDDTFTLIQNLRVNYVEKEWDRVLELLKEFEEKNKSTNNEKFKTLSVKYL